MATVLAFPQSPALILSHLATAKQNLASLMVSVTPGNPTAAEDARWTELETEIARLEDRLAVSVKDATGCSLDLLCKVMAS